MADFTGFQSQSKKPKPTYANDSILESLRGIGGGVGKTVAKDVVGKSAADAFASIFGPAPRPAEGRRENPFARPEQQPAPAMRRTEMQKPLPTEDQTWLKQEIEKVRMELKALASAVKGLNTEVQKAIDQVPVNPGIYHKNFFERLRSVLVIMREQIQNSDAWLAMFQSRKQKKGYWGMYKKHGTTFGLSHERTASTQSG